MTTGRVVRRLSTALVVAVIGIGLSALPASGDVGTASVGAQLGGAHGSAHNNQRAEKVRDHRCAIAKNRAHRAAKRAAELTGKRAVRAAKHAAALQRRAKRLCSLAGPAHPQPPKPTTPPGHGGPPTQPVAPGPPPVLPSQPVPPTQPVPPAQPPVPAPVAPPSVTPIAPVEGPATGTASNTAPNSRAASPARAPAALAKPRASARQSRLPFVISSRDSRIPLAFIPAAVAPKATFPLGLMVLLLAGFLFVQRWIDRGDPKLATAPGPDRDLPFE